MNNTAPPPERDWSPAWVSAGAAVATAIIATLTLFAASRDTDRNIESNELVAEESNAVSLLQTVIASQGSIERSIGVIQSDVRNVREDLDELKEKLDGVPAQVSLNTAKIKKHAAEYH